MDSSASSSASSRRSARIALTKQHSGPMCAICLDPMLADATGNEATATLTCGHAFHVHCILRVARSATAHHGACPICRAGDALQMKPPTGGVGAQRVPPSYEPDGVLLQRAMEISESGNGSAQLRRQVQKLEKMRAEKYTRIAAQHTFRATPSGGLSESTQSHSQMLSDARRRAEERERQVVRSIVGHMRRTRNDQMVDHQWMQR